VSGKPDLEPMSNNERQNTSQEAFPGLGPVKLGGHSGMADLLIAGEPSERPMFGETTMEAICERSNLMLALKRVLQNQGGPGVDGMTVGALPEYLKANWLGIKAQLLKGSYTPQP
jgi:RNA-directed DNA polymerase